MEDLSKGKAVSRRYRNRRIGEFLKELELTEGRSTGISKIIKAMARNGSPAPEFDTDEERSYFLVRLPVHLKATAVEPGRAFVSGGSPEETTQKTTQKTTQRILEILRQHPSAGRREIAELLGDVTEDGVKYQLNKLKALGRITRIGSDKGGYWEVNESL
jgi:ATP-dependent DNA helicase RecG